MFKEIVSGIALGLAAVWLVLVVAGFLKGCTDQTISSLKKNCNEPARRIEYLFPGHLVGCWMGDYPDKEK